jgi:hypothetical protein
MTYLPDEDNARYDRWEREAKVSALARKRRRRMKKGERRAEVRAKAEGKQQ